MTSVASQLTEEVTARAQSDNLEDAREICADGTYFLNNLRSIDCALEYTLLTSLMSVIECIAVE